MSGSRNTNCCKTSVCRGNISLQIVEGSGPCEGKLVQHQWLKRTALGLFLWLGSLQVGEIEDSLPCFSAAQQSFLKWFVYSEMQCKPEILAGMCWE